jgi:hypothetical protein
MSLHVIHDLATMTVLLGGIVAAVIAPRVFAGRR